MPPLVSVSILNYKRRDALERVLESVAAQEYPCLETIVVDNGSGDETTAFIRDHFPSVRLIALGENTGTAARNNGIRAASGAIIITLDNDVWFDSPTEVQRIVAAFERHSNAGCITFRSCHPSTGKLHTRDWCHPRPWGQFEHTEFATQNFIEGSSAFRREVFDRVEGYWPDLFIGHEGFDLSLRMLDAGYEIWYVPDVTVWHMAAIDETRENWRPYYYNTRNVLLTAWRDLPWLYGARFVAPRLAVLAFYAARAGHTRRYLSALCDAFRMARLALRVRKPLKRETLRELRRLTAAAPSAWSRFIRHWRKTEF